MRSVKRVLLVRLSSIGDVIHGLPLLRALKDAVDDVSVDWIIERPSAYLLQNDPDLDRLWVVDRKMWSVKDYIRLFSELKARSYDVAIDVQGLLKSALVARYSGADTIVGFNRDNAREGSHLFYDVQVNVSRQAHVIQKNLMLLEHGLGIDLPEFRWGIAREPEGESSITVWLDTVVPKRDRPLVVLNPGGTRTNKIWEGGRFARLARMLGQAGRQVVVVWGPGEETQARQIVEVAGHPSVLCAPSTSLLELTVVIRCAGVLVTGDSAPLHIASAVGTPVVALFGPTNPSRNGPFNIRARVVRGQCRKSPCMRRRCSGAGEPCMKRITAGTVFGQVEALLVP